MFRTGNTVEMLKPIALIAGLAILLWSLGLPSLSFVQAANVSDFSDTLSDSAPGADSDHDIQFTLPATGSGIGNTGSFTVTFPSGFDLSTIGQEDIDLLIDGTNKLAAEWSVATTATTIQITIDTGDIGAGSTTRLIVGLGATNEGSPNSQVGNPSPVGGNQDYEITLSTTGGDTGATRIVILDNVEVTASVDTVFTFSVSGVTAGGTVNGETITGDTSSTSIPFGLLEGGTASTSAQLLTVQTNAANGYVVTVQTDGALRSSTGADIDGYANGGDSNTPSGPWTVPTGVISQENTWGHWGLTSDDLDIDSRVGNQFAADTWIAASTTPREIMQHDGPALSTSGAGIGTTSVAYKIEITDLQEAGDDYSAILTYIATPTF